MSFGTTSTTRELGNYELLHKIAEGGMGAVFKARHKVSRQIVAIKVIPGETSRQPVLLRRFEQEFRAASLIDHPNVVRAIEYCGALPTPFLVMEFVDGKSLGELIEENGAFPEEQALHIIGQVCEGLHRAHKQGLIHRDVKPDNILLTADGVAKLTDLGLVKDIEGEENLTRTGKGLGTPHFMAPEQFRNAKNADVRCDVYSLGATLFAMVTGKIPFSGTSPLDCWIRKTRNEFPPPRTLVPHLSDRLDFSIRRAMTANPGDRPASCREFMEDLTGLSWRPGTLANISDTTVPIPADATTVWYMVVYGEGGQPKTVKGTTDTIRKNIQAGTLGDLTPILVSRAKTGPFAPLRTVPEFRDLLMEEVLVAEATRSGVRSSTQSGTGLASLPGASSEGARSRNGSPVPAAKQAAPAKPREAEELPGSRSKAGDSISPKSRIKSPVSTQPPAEVIFESDSPQVVPPTDEFSAVPLTDQSTLHLDSAERPRLPTHAEPGRDYSKVWPWVWAIAFAAAGGIAGTLAFLLTR